MSCDNLWNTVKTYLKKNKPEPNTSLLLKEKTKGKVLSSHINKLRKEKQDKLNKVETKNYSK